MLRGTGALLVCGAAAGIGWDFGRQVRRRLDALYRCKSLLLYLQGQIRCGADLGECFREIGERMRGEFRLFCQVLAEAVQGLPGQPFEEIWRIAVEECLPASGLSAADRVWFSQVGDALGLLDVESQCRHLQNDLERLAPEIARAEAETGPKCRLCRSLGICAGVFAAVLAM